MFQTPCRIGLSIVFSQEFEFYSQNFITSLLRNSIFLPSEALLSSIMQNQKKSPSFHDYLPKVLTNFECLLLKFHTLKYHIEQMGFEFPTKTIFVISRKCLLCRKFLAPPEGLRAPELHNQPQEYGISGYENLEGGTQN